MFCCCYCCFLWLKGRSDVSFALADGNRLSILWKFSSVYDVMPLFVDVKRPCTSTEASPLHHIKLQKNDQGNAISTSTTQPSSSAKVVPKTKRRVENIANDVIRYFFIIPFFSFSSSFDVVLLNAKTSHSWQQSCQQSNESNSRAECRCKANK